MTSTLSQVFRNRGSGGSGRMRARADRSDRQRAAWAGQAVRRLPAGSGGVHELGAGAGRRRAVRPEPAAGRERAGGHGGARGRELCADDPAAALRRLLFTVHVCARQSGPRLRTGRLCRQRSVRSRRRSAHAFGAVRTDPSRLPPRCRRRRCRAAYPHRDRQLREGERPVRGRRGQFATAGAPADVDGHRFRPSDDVGVGK